MSEVLNELSSYLREMRGDLFLDASISYDELNVIATPETILALLTFLRDDAHCGFISMIDICGVDWPQREKRFDVVYHLMSPTRNLRIRIKVAVADGVAVPSATGVYKGAEWFEREAWDMYGIPFSGHADLRRLLTDYGFEGHPLRKDFPTTGYVEVRYDDAAKRVVYEPVELK
jgi:NADH-quinone oxidoreductase subunit C